MKFFLFYYNYYNYKIIGNQNLISNNESILFNNSGFSSLKKIVINSKIKITSFQYCLRLKGLYNDLKFSNDGIHQISFIMMGNFFINNNIFLYLKLSIKFLIYFNFLKYKKIFFTVNINDFNTILILLLLKIKLKKIYFTKKNIWKIDKNGFLGFCLEIYYKIKNKLLEIWNIVNIKYLKFNNLIYKIKFNIIDTGFGINRLIFNKKKNLKLINVFFSIFLIYNNININFTKNHNFLLNKLLKKIFNLCIKYKIRFYSFFFYYFKNNKKFYFKYNLKKFLIFLLKKEWFFFFNMKKDLINNLNIHFIKKNHETFGNTYLFYYKIIKKI